MSRFRLGFGIAIGVSVLALACSSPDRGPTAPSSAALASPGSLGVSSSRQIQQLSETNAAQPPFDLEAILRGDGFGLVKFRQSKDPTKNIIDLDVWVRDLTPNTSYSLQRATDTTLDGVCTGANWLTLGEGATPQPIVTDDTGTGRAALWRDLSVLAPGTAFDIHFRIIQNGTSNVPLQSECYRFVVRD